MLRYWIWLATRKHIGSSGMLAVLAHFGTPEAAYHADAESYQLVEGLRRTDSLEDKDLKETDRILSACYRQNIHILTWQDAAYPERLRNIPDPPALLYYQGNFPAIDTEPVIAVVGTRRASAYGMIQAKQLGNELGRYGAIVASGGAAGIDTMALKGALGSGKSVIAVLGGGHDKLYPASNRDLFEDIRAHGCLISEYPPGTPALGEHFPVRNRILSGLAVGTLVVESPLRSGARNTAKHALEQGRDVFTIPANVGAATFQGNLQLLKEGAILVEEGWDVMKEYVNVFPMLAGRRMDSLQMMLSRSEQREAEKNAGKSVAVVAEKVSAAPTPSDTKDIDKPKAKPYIDVNKLADTVSPDEKTILQLLIDGPLHVDLLIDRSQIPANRVLASMTLLEVKGLINKLPGGMVSLAEE